jgi:FKBP-type peptidyl-prolyl cis-trans isomerase FkpA
MAELKKVDTVVGSGAEATAGRSVSVHYTGWLHDPNQADGHGKKFDSSHDRRAPFDFNLGAGQVIRGWDEGVAGMKVGGKRTLVILPRWATAARGAAARSRERDVVIRRGVCSVSYVRSWSASVSDRESTIGTHIPIVIVPSP